MPVYHNRADFGENLKNDFPKEFFNEIWLIIGGHENIKIAGEK